MLQYSEYTWYIAKKRKDIFPSRESEKESKWIVCVCAWVRVLQRNERAVKKRAVIPFDAWWLLAETKSDCECMRICVYTKELWRRA